MYQVLVSIAGNTNPSIAGILTPAFMQALKSCPASSGIFSTQLKDVGTSPTTSVVVCTDGTAQVRDNISGRAFYDEGVATLTSNVAGVGRALFTHSANTQTPIISWTGTNGLGVTTTYNDFGVAWAAGPIVLYLPFAESM
jgi:hypothetical protein